MATFGVDFRATSGYVTDPTDYTYCLGDLYPTTRDGKTFGWIADALAFLSTRDRDNTVADKRLAGINFAVNALANGVETRFQLDKTGAGTIIAAFGDINNAQTIVCSIRDSGGTKFSLNTATSNPGEFYDGSQTLRTSAADWTSNNQPSAQYTFAGYVMYHLDDTVGVNTGEIATLAFIEAGGTAYTLTAANGTYSLAGQSATLLKSKLVTANNGNYALSGQAATLQKTRILTAAQGTYSLSGQTATPLKSKLLTAASGTYSLAGQTATLTYTSGRVLVASAGSYSLAGQSATLLKTSILSAQTGSLSLAGQSALLHYTGSMVIYDTHDGGQPAKPRKDRYREDKQKRREALETAWQQEFHPVAPVIQTVTPIIPPILTPPPLRASPATVPLNDEDEEEALWLLLA